MHLKTIILAAALVATWADGTRAGDTDLDAMRTRHLPWRAVIEGRSATCADLERGLVRKHLTVRRDSTLILVAAQNPGITMNHLSPRGELARWQHNPPPEFCWRSPCASIDGAWDTDGDGDDDVVAVAYTPDHAEWIIDCVDLVTGEMTSRCRLSGGADRRGDGTWDGYYTVMGVGDIPGPDGPQRALIVISEAGFDLEPRGLQAIDPATGHVLWTHFIGGKPATRAFMFGDTDGDGAPEAVFLTTAVNNLGGVQVGGLSDDACAVVAVGMDGTRRWTRIFPGYSSGWTVEARGRDGLVDFVIAFSPSGSTGGAVEILDGATGQTVASQAVAMPRGLVAQPHGGGTDIYVGAEGVGILHLRYAEGLTLAGTARSALRAIVIDTSDLLPTPGSEVFATIGVELYVLGRDLQPLAHLRDPLEQVTARGVETVSPPGVTPRLAVTGDNFTPGMYLQFTPHARPFPWSAIALVPAAAGAAWAYRRRRRGASAATRRELRLQLLARLELSSHGAIGALRSLRRLVWILDAGAQAEAPSPALQARRTEIVAECRDHMLPDLRGIIELATLAGCASGPVGMARTSCDQVARALEGGGDGGLHRAATALEAALVELRSEAEAEFRTDLAAAVTRVLEAHAAECATAGVTVRTTGLDQPTWCRMDAEELVFVLDNLVGNALRAMAGAAVRELSLSAVRAGSDLLLTVADTGCGIPPEDWDAVMETRASSREGGGLGLPASRQVLRKYGGGLAITASEPGKGATFVLNIAPTRAQE